MKDDTVQKRLENDLKSNNENYRYTFDNLSAGIWMKDYTTGQVNYASKAVEDILHTSKKELYNDASIWENMIDPKHRTDVFVKQHLLKKGESIKHKYQINAGDGTTKWVYDQTIPRFNEHGDIESLFGMLVDITPEIEMHQRLDYLSMHDPLTKLPNQQSIYEKIDRLCENNEPFALLYLDIDRFNIINDSLGYQVGDEALKMIADRFVLMTPEEGYIGRLSSNDFVIIVKNDSSKASVNTLAKKLIQRMEEPITAIDYELHITTSIGISFFPDDADNKLTLLEHAHSALYHAKKHGKNKYQIYSISKDISSYKKYILDRDMREAIVNEEFEIYYQPQVDPQDGLILGAEALIRWNHKDWGLVSPGEFISLAEENHLIHFIGDWVIQNVFAQLKQWKDKGITLRPISINVSPIRFMKKGLVELVSEQLALHQIPAKYIEFEITEGSLLKDEKRVLSTLKGLRDLGVKIAIDDFGTGYSSMEYLRKFKPDTIKIDQIFIKNLTNEDKIDRGIISSILHLAKSIDANIVAEGVEEYEQYEFLQQQECNSIQGYLFSKPVQLEKYEQMIQIGYLKPTKTKMKPVLQEERRDFFRFVFPYHVRGEMTITEVANRKVELGSTKILIEDVSLGGLKMVSSLKLPINEDMKFMFEFKLINELFDLNGILKWKNEEKADMYSYGVSFDLNQHDEDRLAPLINLMSTLRNANQEIPDTEFIYEDAHLFFLKN
ncbi:EAL domain-containing protein [Oceanobacillus sp. CF4.6]|uniref:EAL domain-containing protein n=1 Tax=Oceanobacillus sp. CF4.6 TaxID=3373080 RepID=UPI003EE511CD